MDQIQEYIKKPWFWLAAGALFFVLIYLQRSGGSGSSAASAANAGIMSQAEADQTNVSLAQAQDALQAEQDQTIGAQNVAALSTIGNLYGAVLSAGVANNQVVGGIVNNQVLGENAIPLANIATQGSESLASINGNTNINIAQIQAGEQEAIAADNADALRYESGLQYGGLNGLTNFGAGIGSIGTGLSSLTSGIGGFFGL